MSNGSHESFPSDHEEENNLLEKGHDEVHLARDRHLGPQARRRHRIHIIALYASNLILLSILLWASWTKTNSCAPDQLAPMAPIVKWENKAFLDNVEHESIYQGEPTDEIDSLWEQLYNHTMFTSIEPELASKLPNHTFALENGNGLVQVEAFHQLHCLDAIRRTLYPERYPDHALIINGTASYARNVHIGHCVDRLRQGIMCNADPAVTVWQWREDLQMHWINFGTLHTCRNFDAIKDWTVKRHLTMEQIPDDVFASRDNDREGRKPHQHS